MRVGRSRVPAVTYTSGFNGEVQNRVLPHIPQKPLLTSGEDLNQHKVESDKIVSPSLRKAAITAKFPLVRAHCEQ